jgi:hypothetical protein
MVCSDGGPLRDMPLTTASKAPLLQCRVQVVGVVGDELDVFIEDGLVLGELDVEQEDIANGHSGFI